MDRYLIVLILFLSSTLTFADDWPGEAYADSTDLTLLDSDFAKDLSGAYWNPSTRRLWVCDNSQDKFWVIKEKSGGGFEIEKEFSGTGDIEGIVQATGADDVVFLMDENTPSVRSYTLSGSGSGMTATASTVWDLSADIPAESGGSGAEGVCFVPNASLADSGFRDGSGDLFSSASGPYGGLFFIAHQSGGYVYAVDLLTGGSHAFVGKYKTSRNESSGLEFDASTGCMYISHNTGGNYLELTDLTSTEVGGERKFMTLREFDAPNSSNLEGFAITPARLANGDPGDGWCFWTDDDGTSSGSNATPKRGLSWFSQLKPTLQSHAGEGQAGEPGAMVPVSPAVKILDGFANPVSGIEVAFSVTAGGGTITGSPATSDADGIATLGSWTLGIAGANTLEAANALLADSPVLFSATAVSDTVAPAAVDDLLDSAITTSTVTIEWTSPGDDDNTGTASVYDIRYQEGDSTVPFDFPTAGTVDGEPTPQLAGSTQSMTISDLVAATDYQIAMVTRDEADNQSSLSNILYIRTASTPDTIAPAAVSDLSIATMTDNSITLEWTAPGDDGSVGTASAYDLRYSTDPGPGFDFASATQVSGLDAPSVAGSAEQMTVTGLDQETTYRFALITRDEAGNESPVSNIPSATTTNSSGGEDPPVIPSSSSDDDGCHLSAAGAPLLPVILLLIALVCFRSLYRIVRIKKA